VELPLAAGQTAIAFTDGVLHAGERRERRLDPLQIAQKLGCQPACPAQLLADGLLSAALDADDGRPGDDVTVVVVRVAERLDDSEPEIRRMIVSFPVPPI
jgi:serine phosphatase RsbU (regulator of sigma subunit)